MNRLHVMALAALASAAPLAWAGTATFGLFTKSYYKCGSCDVCPGAYNAFSPRCYGVENAGGCTACPIPPQYLDGPYDGGFGQSRGWHGLAPKHFFGLAGHGHGYPTQMAMPPYPCGYIAAFHGVPGGGGCGDPFGGCGTKRPFYQRLCDWKGKNTAGVGLHGTDWGRGFFYKLKEKFGGHKIGGGHYEMDGAFESSELIATMDQGHAAGGCAGCAPAAAPSGPPPAALPVSGVQQMGYYYPAQNGGYYFYPVSYNPGYNPGAYQQQPGYYPAYQQTPYNYYPAYGYPMGY